MKIEQASVAMNSEHSLFSEYDFSLESTLSFRSVYATVSQQADAAAAVAAADATASASQYQQRVLLLLAKMLGQLLACLENGSTTSDTEQALGVADPAALASGESAGAPPARRVLQWSRVSSERIVEHETSDFSSTGTIVTADGLTLDFTLGLSMCRDYSCERSAVEGGTIELRDPLVINFDGGAAELSGQCFSFDLDADGSCENVPQLAGGSGYLAIDRNADGRVNDGSELFGTASGDGFADLAALDTDGNRWLDESDAAFSTLRVWQRDATGAERLTSLHDAGVGALYLGSAQTPFALTDTDNRLLGQVRASGVYLHEDGSAGTLQQIDLAV